MKRGEVWTQAGGPSYAGKPRPALIVQSDLLAETDSVVTCLFTTHDNTAIPSRVAFTASADNGLLEDSDLMADKVMAIPRGKLGRRLGAIGPSDMARVEAALTLVLGFEE
ncbi:type II toxin-antitoxin system PemK/MazF family toxin [Novosphingobium sp.]|uniref:type II toxin-antitoxin system PemK/MazF family toxin n=1 Tax=Novosphingobium sp. TaxID=1874826 RepID=UPI00286D1A95|nr:type II toxin-antitoxin system PemK/MazF family toxin [Novosphingobium sp.]